MQHYRAPTFLVLALVTLAICNKASATISELTDLTSPITVEGVHVDDIVTFDPSPADRIWFSNDAATDVNPQDAANVELVFEGLLGSPLDFVYETDGLTGPGHTHTGDAFHGIAVHYNNKELFFYFATAIDAFTIGDLGQDISNIRTYLDPGAGPDPDPVDVAEPPVLALLLPGLIGLLVARRQKRA